MDYLLLATIICFSIVFTGHVDPLQHVKGKLGLLPYSKVYSQNIIVNIIILTLRKVLNCAPCCSFWCTLILIHPFITAVQVGFIVYIITHLLSTKINTTEL